MEKFQRIRVRVSFSLLHCNFQILLLKITTKLYKVSFFLHEGKEDAGICMRVPMNTSLPLILYLLMLYNHQTDLKDTFFCLKIINTHVSWVKNLLDNKIA